MDDESPSGARAPGSASEAFSILNTMPSQVAIEKRRRKEVVPIAETEPAILLPDDLVLLTDNIKCWLVRIEDISLLEACRDRTLIHFRQGKMLVRRSLVEFEHRFKSWTFFRASRGCIVNLSQVERPRLLHDGRLIFLLRDGNEVIFSRRQSILFRARHGL